MSMKQAPRRRNDKARLRDASGKAVGRAAERVSGRKSGRRANLQKCVSCGCPPSANLHVRVISSLQQPTFQTITEFNAFHIPFSSVVLCCNLISEMYVVELVVSPPYEIYTARPPARPPARSPGSGSQPTAVRSREFAAR